MSCSAGLCRLYWCNNDLAQTAHLRIQNPIWDLTLSGSMILARYFSKRIFSAGATQKSLKG
jgi:hypothetical protein